MKISYITSVELNSNAAQSRQIIEMCKAFAANHSNFCVVSQGLGKISGDHIFFRKIFKNNALNKILFGLRVWRHIQNSDAVITRDVLVFLLALFSGRKVIYEVHQRPKSYTSFVLRRVDHNHRFHLIAISHALKHYLIGSLGISETKVTALHDCANIISTDKILMNEVEFNSERISILHTGSISEGRGISRFADLLKRYDDIEIVHIGGTKEQHIEFCLDKLATEFPTRFFHYEHMAHANVLKIQKRADLLLFPMDRSVSTYWCCSPLKLFEYMASGSPILATSVGTVIEVLDDENAFLFEPDLQNDIFRAMDEFRKANRRELKQMTSKNLKLIEEQYNWNQRAQRIIEICNSV